VRVIGRVDDLLIVKGVKLYPTAVTDLVNGFVPETTGEVRIVLSGPPPKVTPPLRLRVEHAGGLGEEARRTLAQRIAGAMHDRLTVRPDVELVPPGSLSRSTHKKKVIEVEPG
jgi:phenylacetate-CoA ligase